MTDLSTPAELLVRARRAASLTQSELARLAHTSQAIVSRYENGLTTPRPETLEHLLKICQGSRKRPSELLAEHHDELLAILERNGVTDVYVFGSVARGKDSVDSDLDLLGELPEDSSLIDRLMIQQEIEDLLGIEVDFGSGRTLRDHVREEILKEMVPIS